jgi:hypothetical protein
MSVSVEVFGSVMYPGLSGERSRSRSAIAAARASGSGSLSITSRPAISFHIPTMVRYTPSTNRSSVNMSVAGSIDTAATRCGGAAVAAAIVV